MPARTPEANRRDVAKVTAAKRAAGLRRVSVWVPAERAEELRQVAAKMRDEDEQP